jgi:hypothetical protein
VILPLENRYNESFFDTFDNLKEKDNKVKVFEAPQGFGKTHNMICEWLPYVFNNSDVDYVILSAPKSDIITDNKDKLNDVVSNINGVLTTTDIKEFMRRIKNGKKTVLYVSNQAFFVEAKGGDLEKLLVGKNFAIFCDEFHTWSTSSQDNCVDNLGHGGSSFHAKMYKRLEVLAEFSPYIFAVTATPNHEIKGLIPIQGKLQYILANEDTKILPVELAYRSAWMGNRVFKTDKTQLIIDSIEHSENQENVTDGYKNVVMIVCERKPHENSSNQDKFTPEVVLDIVKSKRHYGDIAISTSDEVKIYKENGDIINVDDDDILEKLNDYNDPLKYLICVDKFSMGVNIAPLKTQCILKESDRSRKDGTSVLENALQLLGRLLRPYCGVSLSEFYNNYGGNLSKIDFNKEMNRMYFFCYDTPMWRNAMVEFEDSIAPKMPMFDVELCPTCGGTGLAGGCSSSSLKKFKKVESRLNKELSIAV